MFFTYLIGCLALIAKPGPDLLCTVATAIAYGRRRATVFMSGLVTGCWLWIVLLAAGFAPFFEAHPGVMKSVQTLGACYIAYLAYGTFREALIQQDLRNLCQNEQNPRTCHSVDFSQDSVNPVKSGPVKSGPRLARLYARGIAMAMSNPLTILFFLAFLPHFTDACPSLPGFAQILVLGTLFCAMVPFVYLPLICLAGGLRTRLFGSPKAMAGLKLASATILAAVAAILLIAR